MKILIINTVALKTNGITTVIYDLFNNMNRKDIEAEIVATLESDEKIINSFQSINIKVHNIPYRKKNLIKYCFKLMVLLKKNKYDTVYIHGSSATMAIDMFIAKLCGCKNRIAHSHNSTCDAVCIDKILRPLFYSVYTKALACSKPAGEWMFPGRPYKLIKNGRDTNQYRFNMQTREKMRRELKLNDDTLAVGHVGNFNRQKNHEYLIKVFAEVKKRREDVKLFLMGYGGREEVVKQLVHELHLEDNVVFLGIVNNVHEVLQAMDVMCLPSLYEGLPLVVVEWQIAALPCIISDKITRECVYTDLVKFVSLDASYSTWADTIIESDISKRKKIADDVVMATEENGFDIKKSAEELRKLLIKATNRKKCN